MKVAVPFFLRGGGGGGGKGRGMSEEVETLGKASAPPPLNDYYQGQVSCSFLIL